MKKVTQIHATDDPAADGIVQAALEIAQRDAAIRRDLKAALLKGNHAEAIKFACHLVGVPEIIQLPKAA
jgi:threonine dehydratase